MSKLITLLSLAISVSTFAQTEKVNKILEDHFKAVNQEKLSNVQSLSIDGTFLQNGLELQLKVQKK